MHGGIKMLNKHTHKNDIQMGNVMMPTFSKSP